MELYVGYISGDTRFTEIQRINFEPQTDVTSMTLPINEFTVEVKTDKDISSGQYAYLYDGDGNLLAKYWIVEAYHITANVIRVIARSTVELLERVKLEAQMYSSVPLSHAIPTLLFSVDPNFDYNLDSSLESVMLNGFCPEQTARERLQWICFVTGAYVKTFFNSKLEILPIDEQITLIPDSKIFWQPTLSQNDVITSIKIRAYRYTLATPDTTDSWVTDGINYWVENYNYHSISLPEEGSAPENVKLIEQITLVNDSNYQAILERLKKYFGLHFNLEADILNAGEYLPAKTYQLSTGYSVMSGVISELWFTFGKTTRTKAVFSHADTIEVGKLTIVYKYAGNELRRETSLYPRGAQVTVPITYLDIYDELSRIRTVYRPSYAESTITVTVGEDTVREIDCSIALQRDWLGILTLISVESIVQQGGDLYIE